MDNNIGDDTDIFTILSWMQLEYKEDISMRFAKHPSSVPAAFEMGSFDKVEYSTEDLLNLFST